MDEDNDMLVEFKEGFRFTARVAVDWDRWFRAKQKYNDALFGVIFQADYGDGALSDWAEDQETADRLKVDLEKRGYKVSGKWVDNNNRVQSWRIE